MYDEDRAYQDGPQVENRVNEKSYAADRAKLASPTSSSPMAEAISRLLDVVQANEMVADTLIKRIQHVLSPADPTSDRTAQDKKADSDLVMAIHEIADKVVATNTRLDIASMRVQL